MPTHDDGRHIQMYSYGQVEAVLLKMYGFEPYWLRAQKFIIEDNGETLKSIALARSMSARIKNFQRIGIAPEKPGKGKKLTYRYEDILKWAFCLELTEFGVDPVVIREYLEAVWPQIGNQISLEGFSDDEGIIFIFEPRFMTGPRLTQGSSESGFERQLGWFDIVPHYRPFDEDPAGRRRAIVNISAMTRDVRAALKSLFGR